MSLRTCWRFRFWRSTKRSKRAGWEKI